MRKIPRSRRLDENFPPLYGVEDFRLGETVRIYYSYKGKPRLIVTGKVVDKFNVKRIYGNIPHIKLKVEKIGRTGEKSRKEIEKIVAKSKEKIKLYCLDRVVDAYSIDG